MSEVEEITQTFQLESLCIFCYQIYSNKIYLSICESDFGDSVKLSRFSLWQFSDVGDKLAISSARQQVFPRIFTLELAWTQITDKEPNSKHEGGNDHKSLWQLNCSL